VRKMLLHCLLHFSMATFVLAGYNASAQPSPSQPSRKELEGMMDAYILSKLQDALGLSDEAYGRMVVAQKKLQDLRRDYRRTRMEVLRQIRQDLGRDTAGEEELQPLLDELERVRSEFVSEEQARYRAIDELLDVRQRARYRILETEIQRRLGQLIGQVRRPNVPKRRQP
jgi:hypothetical protein